MRKIVIIGDPGTGKTAMCIRFFELRFQSFYDPTMGYNFFVYKDMEIYDMGATNFETTKNILSHVFSDVYAFLLCTTIDDMKNVDKWKNIASECAPFAKVIIIITKEDLIQNKSSIPNTAHLVVSSTYISGADCIFELLSDMDQTKYTTRVCEPCNRTRLPCYCKIV